MLNKIISKLKKINGYKPKTRIGKIVDKSFNHFFIFIPMLFFIWFGIFNNTPVQYYLINNFVNLNIENIGGEFNLKYSKDMKEVDKIIPMNYEKNIMIIQDNFIQSDEGNTHGNKVFREFKKSKFDDHKLIRINTSPTREKFINIIFQNQKLVNIVTNGKRLQNSYSNFFNYFDLIEYISMKNPKANIILNNSWNSPLDLLTYEKLLETNNNLYISHALPYKGNNKSQDLIETIGKYYDLNNERILFVTKCNDYSPSFTDNYKCSNNNTSLSAPILGFNKFKK